MGRIPGYRVDERVHGSSPTVVPLPHISLVHAHIARALPDLSAVAPDGSADEKGMGLGLRLSADVMRLGGGTLDVRSEAGEGTVFLLELPRGKEARS